MATTVGTTVRRGAGFLASLLRIVGMVIVAILVLYILLTLLDANPANFVTQFISEWAAKFNLGLSNLFTPAERKLAITLNYGVAAIVWLVLTAVVVRVVRRVS